jgi:hypothetical protein
MRNLLGAILIGTIAWAGASAIRNRGGLVASMSTSPTVSIRSQLEIAVLDDARTSAGDASLDERYRKINTDYFGGGLPDVPVSWEPRLDEIAAARGDGLLLEGLTDGKAIVINPRLRSDLRLLVATLCHEMVHVRLVAAGAPVGEDHGPEFQKHLRRLLDEGAFEGAFATDEEKAAMKASLATDVAWLDDESVAVRAAAADLDRDRKEVDRVVEDLNARITKANAEQTGWPSEDEQKTVKDRLAVLNTRSEAHNARVAAFNERIDAYNKAVDRYNLVVAYPDGLAETRIQPRQTIAGVGVPK